MTNSQPPQPPSPTFSRRYLTDSAYQADAQLLLPNARCERDTRTPEELMALIEEHGREVAEALAALRVQGL